VSLEELRTRLGQRRAELHAMQIVVLAGGSSAEREISLVSGKAVAEALSGAGHHAELLAISSEDITYDRTLAGDQPAQLPDIAVGAKPALTKQSEEKLPVLARIRAADMIVTTLHGTRGEDGVWQGLLELAGVPYVSAGVKGSALAMDKLTSKRLFAQLEIPTPPYWVQRRWADCRKQVPPEITDLVAKPVNQGSSVGIEFVTNDDGGWTRITELNQRYDPLLLEQRIAGRELTASVIGPLANPLALPLVEIRPKREFYDYTAKYTAGQTEYICPAPVEQQLAQQIQRDAVLAYRELELEPYSRLDCILDHDGGWWFLEANTLPGFTSLSLLPRAAKAAGIAFTELLQLLMLCALERWEMMKEADHG